MALNNNTHICPICGFANEAGATRCGNCGIAVTAGTTTVNVPDTVIEQAVVDTQHFETKHRSMVQDGIVLYIAGETQPLILRGKSSITLGRQIEGEPADVVDTTPYYGHLLGVSRQHAKIEVSADGCVLTDLNSTNGTFLNEKRLMAHTPYFVHNGDQVRLGQLIMFVYFSSASTRQQVKFKSVQDVVTLLAPRQSAASYLAATISPYLDTLLTLQLMLDGLLQRRSSNAAIKTIHIDAEDSSIEVDLEGMLDVIQVVQNVLYPWQEQNPVAVAELRETGSVSTPVATPSQTTELDNLVDDPEEEEAPTGEKTAPTIEAIIAADDSVKIPAEAASIATKTVEIEDEALPDTDAEEKAAEDEPPAEEEAPTEAKAVEDEIAALPDTTAKTPQDQLAESLRQKLINGQQTLDMSRMAAYEDQMVNLLQTLTASMLELIK